MTTDTTDTTDTRGTGTPDAAPDDVPPAALTGIPDAAPAAARDAAPAAASDTGANGVPDVVERRLAELELANLRLSQALHDRERAWARLRLLHTISRAFAEAEDFGAAIGVALREVCRTTGWDLGEAWVPSSDGAVLECCPAWYGPDRRLAPVRQASHGQVFGPSEGLPGRAWASGKAVWIEDVGNTPWFLRARIAKDAGLKAGVAIPVLAGSEVAAVLGFFVFEPREEDEVFVELVSIVAAQLGALVQRKRAEADLQFQKALLESQSEAAIDGILVVDSQGTVVSFNRRFLEIWDLEPDEVHHRHVADIVQRVRDLVAHTSEDGVPAVPPDRLLEPPTVRPRRDLRDEVHLHDGRILERVNSPIRGPERIAGGAPVEGAGTPGDVGAPHRTGTAHRAGTTDHAGTDSDDAASGGDQAPAHAPGPVQGQVWFFRDVTERRRAESQTRHAHALLEARTRELESVVEELRTSDQYKSDFLTAMSHELRTPLNAIIGYGELMQDHAADRLNKRHQRALDAMVDSARHLLSLINDLLDLSKVSAGRMELDPGLLATRGVLDEVRTIMAGQADAKGIDLQVEIAPQAEMAYGDARRVEQCLLNLASNAVKFSPQGSRVVMAAVPHPEGVLFTVADAGPGIDAKDQKRLFREFVQLGEVTRRDVGGTGLGLALTKKLVELHGGHIWVDSEPGKGSAFHFVLPSPRSRPRGREVLVVEDDPTLRTAIAGWLKEAGVAPVEASSGEAALAYLSEGLPSAVMLDLNLPGVTGLEVAARLRAMPGKADLPLMFVTSVRLPEVERVARNKFQGVWLPKTAELRERILAELRRLGLTEEAPSPAPPMGGAGAATRAAVEGGGQGRGDEHARDGPATEGAP